MEQMRLIRKQFEKEVIELNIPINFHHRDPMANKLNSNYAYSVTFNFSVFHRSYLLGPPIPQISDYQ